MTGRDCETIRDLLPELAAGSVAPEELGMVEAHLGVCPDCRKELDLVRALRDVRPEVPPGLEARIQARVQEEVAKEPTRVAEDASPETSRGIPIFGLPRRVPAWALSAAAVVILALSTAVIWNQRVLDVVQDPIVVASQDPLPEAWLWDDGMVAGAPVFDGLSDEDLEALLEELEG
jgi:predicted anti-sigma-YlaC factor YlaD